MRNEMQLAEILARGARELSESAQRIAQLEAAIGDALAMSTGDGSVSLYDLQAIDTIRQSIEGLSLYFGELGHHVDEDWRVDVSTACSVVSLAALADRLVGRSECSVHGGSDDSEIFFFESAEREAS